MDTILTIKSGNCDVISTGSVIQFNTEPVIFSLYDLSFNFTFMDNGDNPPSVRYNLIDKAYTIFLYNFNNSLGTGNSNPLELGTIDNRKLYLNYRVYALDNLKHSRTIYYTFYLGEEITNG